MIKRFLLFLTFLLCISSINAGSYADITIDVDSDGSIDISGSTDYSEFNSVIDSQEFTSKDGEYWILNLSSDEILFDSYIFELNLPKNSEINYLKTTKTIRFVDREDSNTVIGTGENKVFNLLVQYKLGSGTILEGDKKYYLPLVYGFLLILVLALITFILHKLSSLTKNKNSSNLSSNESVKPNKELDLSIYSQRQQDVIKLIKKNDGKLTQKKLE